MRRLLIAAAMMLGISRARAQELPAGADSAIARARQQAAAADTAGARRILDSLLTSPASTPLVRGEAVYWSSRLASASADRERILGTLIIDQPFSPRLADALYELGTLELARNDRDRAVLHLGRYLSASSADSNRAPAALALGRLLLERGEMPRACAVLLVGRGEVPAGAIELRNQFEFSVNRCQGIDTTSKADSRARADTVSGTKRTGAYTVQVAAYDTRPSAERLATTLKGQGLDARVVGTTKPFRVRVGRYATHAEAEEASRRVDSLAKTKSMVVIVGPEER